MRILVIEDQSDLRESIVQALREKGYATDSSEDGEEGLYKALNWDYDAIILDIMLPKLDGWSVLEKLRKEKQTPVLMLTALNAIEDRVRGLNTGADDYLPKPFDIIELVARVGAIVRRNTPDRSPEITVGNVKINTAAQQIFLDNKLLELTAYEYAMAETLIKQRGKVVSRTYLYEHLFDENDETMSNMLDVYIYKLRQKLGKTFIKTRRGQGYIVEE